MVKLNLLEPFDTYKTRPPMIAPETKGQRKKGQAYMVLAPTIEQELMYLSNPNNPLKFRSLTKYFIDKRWDHLIYGQGRKVIKLNNEGEITNLLKKYDKGNLSNLDGVTSYLSNVAARPLKGLNVLVECNYLSEYILDNPKDRRMITLKTADYINECIRVAQSAGANGYLGDYSLNVFIPVDLWWNINDLKMIMQNMKPAKKNQFGAILAALSDPKTLAKFGDPTRTAFYLTYGEIVLPFTAANPANEDPKDYYISLFKRFSIKAQKANSAVAVDMDEKGNIIEAEENEEQEEQTEVKLQKAEKETVTDIATEKVVEKVAKNVPEEKRAKVVEKVEASVKKTQAAKATVPEIQTEEDIDSALPEYIPQDDVQDIVVAAATSGQSVASQKRNEQLKVKYKELNIGKQSIDKVITEQETVEIPNTPIKANVTNESLKNLSANQFEAAYNKDLATKDLVRILMHFSNAHPAMYLNKDIQVEDVSTPTDRVLLYQVDFEDENRVRHHLRFKLPKMYKDKYFYLADQQLNIIHQKVPFPITKVAPDKCQAVTNYKKIFTSRYGYNISPRITKLKKIFTSPECPKYIKVQKGNAVPMNEFYLTSIEYDEIGSDIIRLDFAKSTTDVTRIFFVADDAKIQVDITNPPKVEDPKELEALNPLGVRVVNKQKTFYYVSGSSNIVYDQTGKSYGELSEFIIYIAGLYDPKFQDLFHDVSPGSKFVYSRCRVLAADIPLILVVSAAEPGGLITVLEKAKINYTFSETRSIVDKSVKGIIPFSDGYLIYDRYPYENSLLLNGLQTIPTKEISFYEMNSRDTYIDIFDMLYGRKNLYDGLQTFYYMFVDPITADILIRLDMPTDFTRVMLYCNDILADNTYQIDSDYHNSRLRSNEIVLAYLYTEFADAWGRYKDGKAEKFSIPEDAILKKCLTSNIVDPHSELNITLETENDRQVKLKGPSGMNEDHSFTLEKRAFHPSMTGIIGANSTPSGGVGINRHLTLNTNIQDARGFITVGKNDYDGTELLTPGEMMQAFGPESADVERMAMAISQSKHVVPVKDSVGSPISYDMERVIPYLSNDFARTAKMDGQVVAIENDIMIIKYADGTVDDIDLSERPASNTDGGFYIMNQMSTDLKVGSKVKAGDLVAYDKKYINNQNDLFGDPLSNSGTLARVAIETSGGVYEDGCYLTDELAHRMATRITRQKRVILSKYANIKHIVKVGQEVKANEAILTFDDTADEFSSQMLANLAAEAGDADEIIATSAPVITKFSGVIKDIRIYYNIPTDQMTPSMRKLVETYVKDASKREKTLAKYKDVHDATTIVKTSEMLVPDSTGKIKGVKMDDGIFIDFYIEYEDVMAPGDKLTFW